MAFGRETPQPANAPDPPHNLTVALSLAERGIFVFPVHAGGDKAKHPMPFFRWRQDSSTDPTAIRGWWRRWPDAAPAVDLAKSGLFVIDADRHDPEHDGVEAWADIMSAEGASPEGIPIVSTPNDGNHWIFRQDGSLGNGKGRLPAGIDVRGSGGYIVAPGAIMADGRAYEVFGDPADAPPVPSWLTAWLVKEGRSEVPANDAAPTFRSDRTVEHRGTDLAEIEELLGWISPDAPYDEWIAALMAVHAATGGSQAGYDLADRWSSGGRKYRKGEVAAKWRSFRGGGVNGATLAALARSNGADLSAIRISHLPELERDGSAEHGAKLAESFRAAAKAAEPPPKYREEADGSVVDAETGEIVSERRAEAPSAEPGDFPDEALADIPGVVGELADWICAWTAEPIRIHALGAALTIVGTLVARKVFTEVRPAGSHLYVGAVAPSGMGKQHPQDCIRLALETVLPNGRYHTGWAVSLPALSNGLLDKGSRVMIVDEFADKLAGIRSRNASTSATAISEALRTLWGTNIGTYSPDASAGRGEQTIHRPALSLYGASTARDFAASLASKEITNGLFNRFLILPRYGAVEGRAEPTGIIAVPPGLLAKLERMHACLPKEEMGLDGRGDVFPGSPHLVPFSDEAARMNEANRVTQAGHMAGADEDAVLTLYGRYAEQIKRVALILACGRSWRDLGHARIEAEDMAFAERLVAWSLGEFVEMVRREMAENLAQAQHKMVLGIIRKAKKISRTDLTNRIDGRIARRDRDAIIEALLDAENIEEQPIGTGAKGGRPKKMYVWVRG